MIALITVIFLPLILMTALVALIFCEITSHVGARIYKGRKSAKAPTGGLITAMFVLFIAGLGMLIYSGM